jgi:hypothetical protein
MPQYTDIQSTESYNSFQVKRRSGGGSLFSRDPLNLANKQTRKHAGFINSKVRMPAKQQEIEDVQRLMGVD